jgi:CRP-like cAMP-binding protein
MDLFEGLTIEQKKAIRDRGCITDWTAGQDVFQEGDSAHSCFVVLRGKIEVYRVTTIGRVTLTEIGAGDVFGELGMLGDASTRTASAKCLEDSLLFEMPKDCIEFLARVSDLETAEVLGRNFFRTLAKRVRTVDERDLPPLHSFHQPQAREGVGPKAAIEIIEKALPKGIIRFLAPETMQAGEYLCTQGQDSEAFFFVRKGSLEVIREVPEELPRCLAKIKAPAVAGLVGFFAREPRYSTLKAMEEVVYSSFTSLDYERLKIRNPEDALRLLSAAAQVVVFQILQRENS